MYIYTHTYKYTYVYIYIYIVYVYFFITLNELLFIYKKTNIFNNAMIEDFKIQNAI